MIADWFNFFLLGLYLSTLGVLATFLYRKAQEEWRTPHVDLAIGVSVWVVGMTLLRMSSIFRIFSDRFCSPTNLASCLGGGTADIFVYNVGVGLNAFGLLCTLRILASMHGEYAWVRLFIQSAALATIAVALAVFFGVTAVSL